MLREIIMPKMSNTQIEGQLIKWMKQEGDSVEVGELIMEILTDKVTMLIESSSKGFIRKLLIEPGDIVKIGKTIGYITSTIEENIPEKYSLMTRDSVLSAEEVAFYPSPVASVASQEAQQTSKSIATKTKVSPRAMKILKENNLNVDEIKFAGEFITEKIVNDYLASRNNKIIEVADQLSEAKLKSTAVAQKYAAAANIDIDKIIPASGKRIMKEDVINAISKERKEKVNIVTPYIGIRKIIGDRLSMSKFTAPHLYFKSIVNMSAILNMKDRLGKIFPDEKIGINVLVLYATVKALKDFPEVNSSLQGDKIIQYANINLGVAVDSPQGLLVPKIRKSETLSLKDFNLECTDIIARARSGKLLLEELQDGTFTVSNLGMMGIDFFTAIINPPEAGILAVSAISKKPVVIDDQICIAPCMNICFSADHRIIDGGLCARFVERIRLYLENPEMLTL